MGVNNERCECECVKGNGEAERGHERLGDLGMKCGLHLLQKCARKVKRLCGIENIAFIM